MRWTVAIIGLAICGLVLVGCGSATYKIPTEEKIGIPFYPGAKVDVKKTDTEHANESITKAKNVEVIVLWLKGPTTEEVTNWYQEKLSSKPGYDFSEGVISDTFNQITFKEGEYNKYIDIYPNITTPSPNGFTGVEIRMFSMILAK
jgi:hypothetical protein